MTLLNLKKHKCKFLLAFAIFSFYKSFAQVHAPEYISFEPVNANNMVELSTGDFNYNIPLFEVPGLGGGYPVNLFYHAGITMEQEASWVGLGWNINMGSVERNVNGYPDDWKNKHPFTNTQRNGLTAFDNGQGVAAEKSYWKIGKGLGNRSSQASGFGNQSGNSVLNSYTIFGDEFAAYGPLYFKDAKSSTTSWGTQDKDIVMDVYANPYDGSHYVYPYPPANNYSNNLTLPNYDSYVVSANGLIGNISPRIFEFGSLVDKGYEGNKFEGSSAAQRELFYNNRFDFEKNQDKIHFYFKDENAGYLKINNGSFSSNGTDPIWDNSYSGGGLSDVIDGKSFYNSGTERKGGAKFVQWYTNAQMQSDQEGLAAKGVMEYDKLLEARSDTDLFDPRSRKFVTCGSE